MSQAIDGADKEERLEGGKEELKTEELSELQSEQQKALAERSAEEEAYREELLLDEIGFFAEIWEECGRYFEDDPRDTTAMTRALKLMKTAVRSHFQRVKRIFLKSGPSS